MKSDRIGLAVSGGGFRATAFALGCMRAMHDLDYLDKVRVVSGISGGSLLTAMWAYGPQGFGDFDQSVTELVRNGIQKELLSRALSPRSLLAGSRTIGKTAPGARKTSRTESLVAAIAARPFGTRKMHEVTHPELDVVISATDLATYSAVRFGSRHSSSSPYGRILDVVPVADAVGASAAFPLLLPALSRIYRFENLKGEISEHRLSLTDGGVHDNLGITPLLPGRSDKHTAQVFEIDYVICIDAARGRHQVKPAKYFLRRVAQSFDIAHTRSQDGGRASAYAAVNDGSLQGFVHAYLGMRDDRLPRPLADLIPRSPIAMYGTNFAGMPSEAFHELTIRGEQLTRILIREYIPGI